VHGSGRAAMHYVWDVDKECSTHFSHTRRNYTTPLTSDRDKSEELQRGRDAKRIPNYIALLVVIIICLILGISMALVYSLFVGG
jgi:hypothetical protein